MTTYPPDCPVIRLVAFWMAADMIAGKRSTFAAAAWAACSACATVLMRFAFAAPRVMDTYFSESVS